MSVLTLYRTVASNKDHLIIRRYPSIIGFGHVMSALHEVPAAIFRVWHSLNTNITFLITSVPSASSSAQHDMLRFSDNPRASLRLMTASMIPSKSLGVHMTLRYNIINTMTIELSRARSVHTSPASRSRHVSRCLVNNF